MYHFIFNIRKFTENGVKPDKLSCSRLTSIWIIIIISTNTSITTATISAISINSIALLSCSGDRLVLVL